MAEKITIPFTNTRYSLFSSVKVGDDNSTDYTDSSTMHCLREHENVYQYFTSDKSVQRTIPLTDMVNCFVHLFFILQELYILPEMSYLFSGSSISIKNIDEDKVTVDIKLLFYLHSTQYLVNS